MKQRTLDSFLNIKHKRIVPETFCLNSDFTTKLYSTEDDIFVKKCNIRYLKGFFEVSLYASSSLMHAYVFPETRYSEKSVPFFKSLLQKAIRRGFVDHALYACYTLLQIDHMTLYRRLPIIMIEDVRIHEGFATLVWHMMADIPPSEKTLIWILGLVQMLCEHTVAVNYENTDMLPNVIPDDPIVWAIIFRIEYGGMKGDIQMLKYIVCKICENDLNILQDSIKGVSIETLKTPTVWMYEAIDFHILPSLLLFECNFTSTEIKKMMWYNASSINFRRKTTPYRLEDWKSIAFQIRSIQIRYFNSVVMT